ncbi:MAG: 3-oxoacyl-[acyl-carrier-protein] synthase [Pseudomonadota bacterium]|nr:3-oxoacyl-[acyl-carrier-protein] synthase [Pseudomonadota bacterium]
MNNPKRVVITGMGIVSPVGNDLGSSWYNIKNGISGIDLITRFDATHFATKFAGEVKGFSTAGYIDDKDARRMDLFIRYGMVAGIQAIKDSGIEEIPNLDKTRVGLIIGSGIGGLPSIEDTSITLRERGPRKISPFFITGAIGNMVAGNLSILYGYQGVNYGITSACATGNHCIGDAMRFIQHGDCDIILAGGAESPICGVGIGGFNACRALSTRNDDPKTASRPWDRGRDGFVMGEGSAVLVLEEYEHAKQRGAKIYAELIGYAATADAFHMTAPTVDGPLRSMKQALASAKINTDEVDYINAHGTSTPVGDINETNAMKACFGDDIKNISISSTKSMTGHLLGAASSIEAVFSIMALRENLAPPTINIFEVDEGCDLDYTANVAKERTINIVVSNSFGFGGVNSTVIFKKIK